MRVRWDKDCIVSTEAGPMLESLGVKAITLHPRTRSQSFGGKSIGLIKDLKSNVKIPIIGNGDIKNSNDAINMFNETNCDAIMELGGGTGNPWLLKSINNKLLNKLDKEIFTKKELKHVKSILNY